MKNTLLLASLLAGTFVLGSCGKDETEAAAPTLYDRLGKTEGIAKIVDGLIANVGAETTTANSVMLRSHKPMLDAVNGINGQSPTDPTRLQRLRNNFIDQLGEATGGPLTYKGKSMLVAHTGMNVTALEFSVWHKQLEASLASNGVSESDKAAVYAIVDKMEGDVVGH
ncbi:group I truncated hemoglobin [Hymenobacter cellulosivorans]|uniref:Group 1 truncated hemoglobin n=1 Tax=Hymenobacter cellulosivorans TaxID=2932249 RepID=A0ABY4FE79_9BACT|nr:group 1 truncated hemoglobin [Hymenobacter cellulosivorans]UOQ54318.1 group 1 truncated hemoglobin [Hymenobacter cellulosivorans]